MNYSDILSGFAKHPERTLKTGEEIYYGASPFAKALGEGTARAGLALGALALLAGGRVAYKGIQGSFLSGKFQQALEKVKASNILIQSADPAKVESYAATIFKFAPHIAADPNLLSAVLANAIHGEGIDPMTIKTLQEMEERYNKGATALVSPIRIGG